VRQARYILSMRRSQRCEAKHVTFVFPYRKISFLSVDYMKAVTVIVIYLKRSPQDRFVIAIAELLFFHTQ